jgi:proline racemase
MEALKLVGDCSGLDVGRTIEWGGRYFSVVDVGSVGLTLQQEEPGSPIVHKTYQLLKLLRAEWAAPNWDREA